MHYAIKGTKRDVNGSPRDLGEIVGFEGAAPRVVGDAPTPWPAGGGGARCA